jgi:hypothetical protein
MVKNLWAWNHIATFQVLNQTLHNANPIFWHLCFTLLSHTNKNLALLFQYTRVAIFHFQNCNSFFKFSSTLLTIVSKNKSNQNQKNWTHTMPMPSFFYGILAPLPSTSTLLPKLQLLSMYISCMLHSIQIENSHLWTLICVLLQIRSNAKTSSAFATPQVQLSWLLMINLCTMPQIVTTNKFYYPSIVGMGGDALM